MKHLFIGIDGTWRAAFADPFLSNVFRLNLALDHQDKAGNPQVFMYSGGLGTNGVSSRITGGLLSDGLDENILQAYINICSNYEAGDKLYVFGFSRGAIAARALCAFITACGLLKAEASWLINVFWKCFANTASLNERAVFERSRQDQTYADARIEFLGVFDTVCGPLRRDELLRRLRFETFELDPSVDHGVHIVSIDDTRLYFSPVLWDGPSSRKRAAAQTIEQIWMPGVHSDVGGGYPDLFLSNLSAVVMLDKLVQHCPDLLLNSKYIGDHILRSLAKDDIVINDEWGYKLSSFLSKRVRRAVDGRHAMHSAHPFIEMIRNKRIRIRKSIERYIPAYQLNPADRRLGETQFEPASCYAAKVRDILAERATDLA